MACPSMPMILFAGRWKRMIDMSLRFLLVVAFAFTSHSAICDVQRLADQSVMIENNADYKQINVYIQRSLNEQLKEKSLLLDKIATEHISFLTDKVNFLTILVTVVFALFGISSVVVTIASSKKLMEYRESYKEACEKMSKAIAAIGCAEKKMYKVQSRTCYNVARNIGVMYKSMNKNALDDGEEREKEGRGIRRENLRSFLSHLRYGLRYAIDAGDYSFVYNYVTTLNPLLESLKNDVGLEDMRSVRNSSSRAHWPDKREVASALNSAAISVKMREALLGAYANLLNLLG